MLTSVSAVSPLSWWLGVGRKRVPAVTAGSQQQGSAPCGYWVGGRDTRVSALTLTMLNPPGGSWVGGWRDLSSPVSQTRKLKPRDGKSLTGLPSAGASKCPLCPPGEDLSLPPQPPASQQPRLLPKLLLQMQDPEVYGTRTLTRDNSASDDQNQDQESHVVRRESEERLNKTLHRGVRLPTRTEQGPAHPGASPPPHTSPFPVQDTQSLLQPQGLGTHCSLGPQPHGSPFLDHQVSASTFPDPLTKSAPQLYTSSWHLLPSGILYTG